MPIVASRPVEGDTAARPATGPNWLRLGLAAVLGAVAGTTLFAGTAHGRRDPSRP